MTDRHDDDIVSAPPAADTPPAQDHARLDHAPHTPAAQDRVAGASGDHTRGPASDGSSSSGAQRATSQGTDAARSADAPQYGVGPFSVREVVLLGIWAVAFIVSFFPLNTVLGDARVLVGGTNVWLSGLWWIAAIALPTLAVGLLVLRRLSPSGIRRVGSLGIDQFASVAFSVAAFVWVAWVWDTVAVAVEIDVWPRSWVVWVEAVLMVAGVVFTVFAPFIPPFEQDFQAREEVPAHRNARPIRAVVARPRAPRAPRAPRTAAGDAAAAPASGRSSLEHDASPTPGTYTGSTDLAHDEAAPTTTAFPAATATDSHDTDVFAPLRDTGAHGDRHPEAGRFDEERERGHRDNAYDRRDSGDDRHDDARAQQGADEHPHAAQAFWALVPEEREIVDDYGRRIFLIGPTAWALVVEDRGETFVVRHDDGRIGYLHDVSGVTRG